MINYFRIILVSVIISYSFCLQSQSFIEVDRYTTQDIYDLTDFGYFSYAKSKEIIYFAKFVDSIEVKYKILDFNIYDESCSMTRRNYHVDAEYLSDFGGIETILNRLSACYFEYLDLDFTIGKHYVYFDEEKFEREEWIIVNNRRYDLFLISDNVRNGQGRYIAPSRLVEMINKELIISDCDDRLYLVYADNDLQFSFLTKTMKEFFDSKIKSTYHKPKTVDEWLKYGGILKWRP